MEDDVIENNLKALEAAIALLWSIRGVATEQLPEEALLVMSIVTSLDAALCVYSKRRQ
jgi:hypothetical protein